MDEAIIFKKTAFKHHVTEAAIRHAFDNSVYEMPMEIDENKILMLGWDGNTNLLEIIYNRFDENTINVFHAMPCRPLWRKLANH